MSTQEGSLAPAQGFRQEYSLNRGKSLKTTGLFLLLAAACASPPFLKSFSPVYVVWCAAGALLAIVVAALLISRLMARGPALVVSESEVRMPAMAAGPIPWSAILDIQRLKVGDSLVLKLRLTPAAVKALSRRGFARFSSGSAVLSLPLSQLNGDADAIAAQCETAWRTAVPSPAPIVPAIPSGASAAFLSSQPVAPAVPSVAWTATPSPSPAVPAAPSTARTVFPEPPPIAPASPRATLRPSWPWLTYVLIIVLGQILASELVFGVGESNAGSPSIVTLAYMGGIIGVRVWRDHEWWRLFTAPLLHAGVLHLVLNAIVLWAAGTALETLVGWRWLGALFTFSALGGAVGSLFFNAPNVVGVGASGGIMGLLGGLFVMSFRLPASERLRPQIRAAQAIVPALLPIVSDAKNGQAIDYAAHGGGLLAGAALAVLLLRLCRKDEATPPFGPAAATLMLAYFAVAAASLFPIIQSRAAALLATQ
jgi:membrane associated rhomboid family serine protease